MEIKNLTNEEKLDEMYRLTRENHEMIRSMRRQQTFATILRVLYWLVVLGALGSTYYFIKPVIDTFSSGGMQSGNTLAIFNQLKDSFPETKLLNQVMEWFKKSATTQQ